MEDIYVQTGWEEGVKRAFCFLQLPEMDGVFFFYLWFWDYGMGWHHGMERDGMGWDRWIG